MTGRRSAARVVAGLMLLGAACSSEQPRRTDDTGGWSPYPSAEAGAVPARRVVSLVPSATETIRALGRMDVLIGRTDFDTASWARPVASVGGGIEPSLEAIVALEPDLVIRFEGEQDTRTPARLDDLGISHVGVRPDGIEDIYDTIALVGAAIGESERADSLAAEIRAGLAAAAGAVSDLPRVRVAYLLDGTPPWVAGPGTFIDEILSLMGGDNVFADLGALYAPVSPEQLRGREVDVVLLAGTQAFDASLVPGARIERAGGALDLPGPGVVEAAQRVGELLHGRSAR
jgi:iron complex transport system substrate-binding protein